MKKTLLIAAIAMAATPAFATKARKNALQSPAHLTDSQTVFEQPHHVAMQGEYVTFEGGATTPGSATAVNAEGGFVRNMGDASLGFYLGHQPGDLTYFANLTAPSANSTAQSLVDVYSLDNPFNVQYAAKAGDITWGANLFYLNSDKKNATQFGTTANGFALKNQKANVMGVSASATNGVWDAYAVVGLNGKSEGEVSAQAGTYSFAGVTALVVGDKAELKSKSSMKLAGGYRMDTMYFYGSAAMAGAKVTRASTDLKDWDKNTYTLGVVNSHKKDGVDFFYGASYVMDTLKEKVADSKTESTKLPVIIGVEADATSWLVARASLTQNLILGSSKTTTAGTGDADSIDHNSTVAAGLGLKLGKFTLDGSLAMATTGAFGSDANFLTQGSLTYMF